MIRLTLFYFFAFNALSSALLLFFIKDYFKAALVFFNIFLSSAFICIIFRRPIFALFVLISGALLSLLGLYSALKLRRYVVPAKGVTPKIFKLFSALICGGLFFSMLTLCASSFMASNKAKQYILLPSGLSNAKYYIPLALSLLFLFSLFIGAKLLFEAKKKI